ncbi:MAG: hypothetical protein CMF48_07485 [Legionellales bacterium]|nr:hypothetical protein [Legionellales bacterium]|tara:strand:+ start:723 stop:1085 length:363 start_codon:yes stop_codon:yes gene_type:complete
MNWKQWLKILTVPVVAASLCCLSPLLLVMFGLASVSFAASLTDTLYWEWRWAFRLGGFLLLMLTLFLHWRKQGICTLDAARRRRNELLNQFIIAVIAGVLGYFFFLYVVVHYIGVWFKVW